MVETHINLDDITIKRIGTDPNKSTLIFLHDSLGCIELWRDFPQKLGTRTNCNVLIYDRLGYGSSGPLSHPKRGLDYMEREADILNDLLNHWEIDEAVLFGHSDGGSIALIAAGKYPQKIKGVITEGAHIFVEDVTIKGINEAIKHYEATNLKSKLEKYHGSKAADMFWAWASTWTTDAFKNWNIESFLPQVVCPTLIIQGAADEYGTLKQVEGITTQTKGSSTPLIIPNIKHTPHKEVPELILEKASEFINQL